MSISHGDGHRIPKRPASRWQNMATGWSATDHGPHQQGQQVERPVAARFRAAAPDLSAVTELDRCAGEARAEADQQHERRAGEEAERGVAPAGDAEPEGDEQVEAEV